MEKAALTNAAFSYRRVLLQAVWMLVRHRVPGRRRGPSNRKRIVVNEVLSALGGISEIPLSWLDVSRSAPRRRMGSSHKHRIMRRQ
jgi:hypothetical protein